MIRTLIVDDESIFRMGLTSCIPWRENGFEVVGEAVNGQDALQKIESLSPQVVLLDIRMPLMGGIEVLRETRDAHPDICFIMLSCTNEYEYVRESMKLGAFDYLFKPLMDAPGILHILLEARKKLETVKNPSNNEPSLEKRQAEWLQTLCHQSASQDAHQRLAELHLSLPFQVVALKLRTPAGAGGQAQEDTRMQVALALCRQMFARCAACVHAFPQGADDALCVLTGAASEDLGGDCERLTAQYALHTGGLLDVGYDAECAAPERLSASVARAQQAQEDCFFLGHGHACACHPDWHREKDFKVLYSGQYQKILEAGAAADSVRMLQLLREILSDVREKCLFDREGVCQMMISLLIDTMRLFDQRIVVVDLFRDNYNMIAEIGKVGTLEEAERHFASILAQLFNHLNIVHHSANAEVIRSVQEYIIRNYMRDMTLNQLAAVACMNKNYLCTLYKQETGGTLFTYIAKIRIDAACRLLRETGLHTYEVSEAVGYRDYRHFCKTFRKLTGVSPSQMREQGQPKEQC